MRRNLRGSRINAKSAPSSEDEEIKRIALKHGVEVVGFDELLRMIE